MLVVEFKTQIALRQEFFENISRGGLFIPTSESFELRSIVEVRISLSYCNEHVVLEGEVVHCIPESMRSETVTPGIAVQIDRSSQELLEVFEPYIDSGSEAAHCEPEPKSDDPVGRDRRDSPRHTARVQARICLASGEELAGVTRNVSASGLLFSVTSDAPEVGARVSVTIVNPVSFESIEIASRVVHHVEGEAGNVPAVGIRFRPEESEREGTRAFLERLDASEHSRRLGGISGDIAELGIASLLQSFAQSTQNGTITLMHETHEGYIAFEKGDLVACRLGPVKGVKALSRMLAWRDGRFEFHARIDPDLVRESPVGLEAAILGAICEVDERERDRMACFAPALCFVIDRVAADGLGPDMDKVEMAIVDLLDVGANVRRLLDVIPEPDAKIQQALTNLVDLGVIRGRS